MKVHRIVLYIIDSDQLGAAGVQSELEETRYANDCINPRILEVQTRDIGEWSDDHPLNNMNTSKAALSALFTDSTTP